jgi:hypothetical protein
MKITEDRGQQDRKRRPLTFASHPEIGTHFEIGFSELELGDVIGKGFFGEVRKAKWKGRFMEGFLFDFYFKLLWSLLLLLFLCCFCYLFVFSYSLSFGITAQASLWL